MGVKKFILLFNKSNCFKLGYDNKSGIDFNRLLEAFMYFKLGNI